MQTVNLDEAKTHLTELIEAAIAGEEVFIAKMKISRYKWSRVPSKSAADSLGVPKV